MTCGRMTDCFYMLAGMTCVSILKHISTVSLYINSIHQNITVCRSYIYFSSKSKILNIYQ